MFLIIKLVTVCQKKTTGKKELGSCQQFKMGVGGWLNSAGASNILGRQQIFKGSQGGGWGENSLSYSTSNMHVNTMAQPCNWGVGGGGGPIESF